MSPTMIFRSLISCILLMNEYNAEDILNKPVLKVLTNDPDDIMIGDNVQFICTNQTKAEWFYLIRDDDTDTARKQNISEFGIADLKINDSGIYTCRYSWNSNNSEPSEPENLYVKDKYPPPKITVKPRKIVRPGEEITITCDARYPNLQFTIYKNFVPIKDSDDNPFSYVIRRAGQQDIGQYVCAFRTKSGSKAQIQSEFSDPIMIEVKDLYSPSVSWEVYVNDDKKVKIICQAPVTKTQQLWFQLLNSSEGIEEEIKEVAENPVTFNISSPDHTQKKYYCIYAIRIGSNFALSAISEPVFIWADYTMVNIIRLLVSALILILLGAILMKHVKAFQETEESPPELPHDRMMRAAKSEYTEMVIVETEHVETEDVVAEHVKTT